MPKRTTRIPLAVMVGLVVAVVLDTFIQITWKLAADEIPPAASWVDAAVAVLRSRWFVISMLAFAGQLWNWLRVLARADLSFAQPFTALSYITVLAVSHRYLHEALSLTRLAGIALILLGVYCVSRTPVLSTPKVAEPKAP